MTTFIELFIQIFEQQLSAHPNILLNTTLAILGISFLGALAHLRSKKAAATSSPQLLTS